MKAASKKAFFNAVFRNSSSTLLTNPTGYLVRIHEDQKIKFAHVDREHVTRLRRLLQLCNKNCHAVVVENDPVDLYFDMEMGCSTWGATQAVLKETVTGIREVLRQHGINDVQNVLVLNASGKDREKQSLHVHVRLDKPVGSKKDVRAFSMLLKQKIPGAAGNWLDVQPSVSGSMRMMHATTLSGERPLIPLDLESLEDAGLRAYLESKAPQSEDLMQEMSLLKRFDIGDTYHFAPPESKKKDIESTAEWKKFSKSVDIAEVIAVGEVSTLLSELPPEYSDDYHYWSKVMWAVKSIATYDPTQYDEELYGAFDEFSQQSPSKYSPESNKREWTKLKGTFPKVGLFTLRKMANEK
eukprot:TRINITY_DN1638_c0_g1_i2.p2 TRINITY_DN1638_c0_g1~~TRINITY_DN1638_c0_g1_i2.p2  ORF type:complete len:354 (+),score=115.37 TRINITY_DN1638_c0_g1_i2:38-1099(+)